MSLFGRGVALLGVSVAAVSSASAQAPQDNITDAYLVDEIIVTATKRAERLIDVPISVVATTGDSLEDRNFTGATDLQYTTPGLIIGDANTPRGAGLRIRGVGTTVFADGIEQSVGTVVDGVPLARAGQGLADLVDIERVEVLRGPQGMLFGRNASAGLVNIVTRLPTDELEIRANASGGTDGLLNLSAAVAGPIADETLRGRISGYFNSRDALVNRVGEGADLNDRNEYGARATLVWDASPDVEIILRGDWSERDHDCCIWTPRTLADSESDPRPGAGFLSTALSGVVAGPDNLKIGAAGGEINSEVISYGGSAEVNWDIGDFTVTSLSSLRGWEQGDSNDADISAINILDRNFGGNDLSQFSQEVRMSSPTDARLEYVLGAFYYESSNKGDFEQVGRFALSFAQAQAAGIDIPLAPGLVLPAAQNFGRSVNSEINVRDFAFFGQGTFAITDTLDLIAGARYTDTKVEIDFSRVGTTGANAFNFLLGGAFAPLEFNAEANDNDLSWRVGLQYELSPSQNIFATISEGYKGPGFNNLLDIVIPAGQTAQDFTRVAPEIPLSYELGYKGQLFDGRLLLSGDVFRTEFKNFQAQVVEQDLTTGINRFAIRNAGELVTQGFEVEARARLSESLDMDFGMAYADSEFEEFQAASCPRLGGTVTDVGAPCGPTIAGAPNAISFDASGSSVQNAPKLTWNIGGRYETPVWNDNTGFVQLSYYWRDDTTFGLYPENIPNPTTQDSFGRVDGSIGFTFADGAATASLFAQNLFDENYVTSIFDLPFDAAGGTAQFVTWDAQRTVGVSLNLVY